MPCCSSRALSPTPESCRSCGVLIAPPQRITSPAVAVRLRAAGAGVVDADRALALEVDLRHERVGLDAEVLPALTGPQVGPRGRHPPAAVDVAVELREALLAVAVDVVGQRVARPAAPPRRRRRRAGSWAGPRSSSSGPSPPRQSSAPAEAGLHALEVRQAVQVVPGLHARVGGPALVVHRVAALEDHPVDAAGAAEHLAAGVEDLAAVHVRLGVGLVLPVVEPVADRDRQRRRHVDERVLPVVGAAGLEHQDRRRRVGAEPVGDGRARGAAADDHVVVASPRPCHGSPANQCWGSGAMLCHTCLVSRYSSSPTWPSSRPMPDCL